MIELHPHIDADIDGQIVVKVEDGQVTLNATRTPYAYAEIVIPWAGDLELEDMDPRDDHRVIIHGSNTGHWEITP